MFLRDLAILVGFCVGMACSRTVPKGTDQPHALADAGAERLPSTGSKSPDAPVGLAKGASEDESACTNGVAKACFRLGELASRNKDPAGQFRYYAAACNAHVGLACVYLGQSVEPDPNKRAAWLKQSVKEFESSCNTNDAEGCYYLGISERGVGIESDATRAQQLYARGCELGNLEACTNEAGLHMQGKGVSRDMARAAKLYATACERRDDSACYWLGAIHEQELDLLSASHAKTVLRSDNLGVELRIKDAKMPARPSPAKRGPAIALLLELDPKQLESNCDQGQTLACYELGVVAQVGSTKLAKNDKKAVTYYEKACNLGNGWGCLRAGDCYEHGWGIKADFAKASKYFLDVCERRVGGSEGFEQECAGLGERIDAN